MAAMQFWGIEVKGKEPGKVKLEEGHIIHLSQAALGELKKDGEPVILHVKVDGKKLVLGILSPENNPQLSFDLVFEKDFEISHNWKNGSVHFLGYQSEMPEGDEFDLSDDDEDEDVPVSLEENGDAPVAALKAVAAKPNKDNKQKAEAKVEDEDDSDDDQDSDDDDEDSDEDMLGMSDDSDDDEEGSEDDDEESSEEETPAKAESGNGKKRKAGAKTPEPKKAKVATPEKTDGKKGGHTATPHPAKKGGKTPSGDKSTPKSGGISCGACKKTFNSEVALQSHSKAKHGGK